jgi:hypothetical protein
MVPPSQRGHSNSRLTPPTFFPEDDATIVLQSSIRFPRLKPVGRLQVFCRNPPATSYGIALKHSRPAQLQSLIVGKTLWVRNTVTGDQFKVVYTKAGQSIVFHIGRSMNLPSEVD